MTRVAKVITPRQPTKAVNQGLLAHQAEHRDPIVQQEEPEDA